MELKHYLAILRRWGWIMVLCTLLSSAASYLFTSGQPEVFEARARYLIGPAIDNPNVNSNDLRASSQVGLTYAELVTSRPILEKVIARLNLDIGPEVLKPNVTATWIDTTQILNIRVRAPNEVAAADIANMLGEVLIERSPTGPASPQMLLGNDITAQINESRKSIRALEAEIDLLASQIQQTTDATAQRGLIVRLDQRRAQLSTSQSALNTLLQMTQTSNTNKIQEVEQAVPNKKPIAPDVTRNVLAALIAGLVLGLAAMLLFEYFTDMIYTPEELRKATGLAYLGGIARRRWFQSGKGAQQVMLAQADSLAAESYRILRTNLQISGAEQHRPSLLITSPSRGDGKSEIAANLAIAFAQAEKQVILIDANMRRPRLAALFGLDDQVGLSNLLETPARPLVPLPIEGVPGLSVLPAGAANPRASEILDSRRMYQLIQELKTRADIVILDSPPLLYSDALALAPQVDGVMLVVNSGATGRENTISAVEGLRMVGARVIGAVLNRVKPEPAYSYYPSRARRRLPGMQPAAALPAYPPALGSPQEGEAPVYDPAPEQARADGALVAQPAEPAPNDRLDFEPAAPLDQPSLVQESQERMTQAFAAVEFEPVDAFTVEPEPAGTSATPGPDGAEPVERSIAVGEPAAEYAPAAAAEPELITTEYTPTLPAESDMVAADGLPATPYTNGHSSADAVNGIRSRRSRGRGRA